MGRRGPVLARRAAPDPGRAQAVLRRLHGADETVLATGRGRTARGPARAAALHRLPRSGRGSLGPGHAAGSGQQSPGSPSGNSTTQVRKNAPPRPSGVPSRVRTSTERRAPVLPRSKLAGLAAVTVALVAVPAVAATADVTAGTDQHGAGLSATIRYTEYGIPHIVAKDYASLGFGQGYAAARDNICAIGAAMLTTSAQRSR